MADNFVVLGSRPGIAQLGTLDSQNVVFVAISTRPSDIYIEVPVAASVYAPEIVRAAATGWAQIGEAIAAEPYVVGVQWSNEVNTANQLVVMWTITVASTSGNSEAQLSILNSKLGPQLAAQRIADLHTSLDDTEAL
jgi:hypothetical protein